MQHQSTEKTFEQFAKDVELIPGLINWRLSITPPRGPYYKGWIKNGLPRRWTLTIRVMKADTRCRSYTAHSADVHTLISRIIKAFESGKENYHDAFRYDPSKDY